jgi:sn-glycerol 3-phosphate transport system substrate-binding protein
VASRRAFFGRVAGLGLGALACTGPDPSRGRNRVRLWFSYGGKNREVLERLVARFNASQREHWVDAVFQGDYFEALAKLRTALAARAGPALSHVVGEVVPYLAEAGVLEPLARLPGAGSLDVVPELGQERSFFDGARRPLVALPFNRSTPIAYLNGRVFDEARLPAPRSWQELRETARALTVRRSGRTERWGFECPISWWFWAALVGQAGGDVVERDGRVTLGGEAGVRAIELWQTLCHGDRTMKPPPGRDYNAWEATNQDFLAGRAAMIWTSTAFLKYLEENARFRVVAAPLPRDRRAAVPTGGTHFVVLRDAPEREKLGAWAFLRFMLEPDSTIEWATSTGYMPVTRSAIARLEHEGYYRKHPNDRVAVDQLAVAFPWPWSVDLFRLQREIVQPRLERAVLERLDPHATIAEAVQSAREAG